MTDSTKIAAEIVFAAEDIKQAMITYQHCPPGGKVRRGLIAAALARDMKLGRLLDSLEYEDEGDRIAQDEEEDSR